MKCRWIIQDADRNRVLAKMIGADIAGQPLDRVLVEAWLDDHDRPDRTRLFGPVDEYKGTVQLVNPVATDDDDSPHLGRPVPIYRRVGSLGPGILRRLVRGALDALESGQIRPNVDKIFPMEEFKEAWEYLRAPRRKHGKVMIKVGD